MTVGDDDLQSLVLSVLNGRPSGMTATELVTKISQERNVDPAVVRRLLLLLLEKGKFSVGPDLNLRKATELHAQ